ncbi:MAG TPA: shikimate dehydrogenase [Allocoleopsis sp.]
MTVCKQNRLFMPKIKGTTKLLGVVGYPIEHSRSPIMHNAAIAFLGVDYIYLPFSVTPDHFATAINGFKSINNLVGFNLTIPHKQAIIPLLDEISPMAKAIKAVNTVIRTERGWIGTNTDVDGFIAPLKTYNYNWNRKKAVILGCGGAARAVVAGCVNLGCAEIHVIGRNYAKLIDFQTSWLNSPFKVNINVHTWDKLPQFLPDVDLLVNTTPIGMYPNINETPIDVNLMAKLTPEVIVYDLIYTPKPTEFLKLAQNQGAIAIDGLEMLVQQGAKALELWLNQSIPIDIMRQAIDN